jgi:hypothetical protein
MTLHDIASAELDLSFADSRPPAMPVVEDEQFGTTLTDRLTALAVGASIGGCIGAFVGFAGAWTVSWGLRTNAEVFVLFVIAAAAWLWGWLAGKRDRRVHARRREVFALDPALLRDLPPPVARGVRHAVWGESREDGMRDIALGCLLAVGPALLLAIHATVSASS